MSLNTKKNILIAPLNWGLGHATRCMPIINKLLQHFKQNVFITADGRAYELLKKEYPDGVDLHFLPGYDIRYQHPNESFEKAIAKQVPKILKNIYREHRLLQKIIRQNKIDIIISDNRYGCWSKQCYNIFLSHQVFLKMPPALHFFEPVLHRLQKKIIRSFQEIWIPDFENPHNNLAGTLAHPPNGKMLDDKYKYIGLLSRMNKEADLSLTVNDDKSSYDLLIVLSGPEPQRSILERKLINQLTQLETPVQTLLVRGVTEEEKTRYLNPFITLTNFLTAQELNIQLLKAKYIISRSGYSSIMDLVQLNKPAILIPTPGQTEQEYLAIYLNGKGGFQTYTQDDFELDSALKNTMEREVHQFRFDKPQYPLLKQELKRIIDSYR